MKNKTQILEKNKTNGFLGLIDDKSCYQRDKKGRLLILLTLIFSVCFSNISHAKSVAVHKNPERIHKFKKIQKITSVADVKVEPEKQDRIMPLETGSDGNNKEKETVAVGVLNISQEEEPQDFMENTIENHEPIAEHKQVPLNAIAPNTLKTFVKLIDLIRREYVEPVSDEVLFANAMTGMLTKLDNHAEFLNADAYEKLRAFTAGEVAGVGLKAIYQPEVNYWVVNQVLPNSAAAQAGINEGDYLHQIAGVKLTEDKSENDVEQLLSGIAGSQVDIVISNAGRRKHTLTLQRTMMQKQSLEISVKDGVAVVRLPVFQDSSRKQVLNGLSRLNVPIKGIVLDLRNNPGGVLNSAVDIASLFMADKTVVQIEGRHGIENVLKTKGKAILEPLPVVILQNRYSASAAEVLASSLQTSKQAKIIGETSYGKGSVQSVIPLNDEQAVKLTVAHYLTANGKRIDNIGVVPDVSLQGSEKNWVEQAIKLLEKQIKAPAMHYRFNKNTDDADNSATLSNETINNLSDTSNNSNGVVDTDGQSDNVSFSLIPEQGENELKTNNQIALADLSEIMQKK